MSFARLTIAAAVAGWLAPRMAVGADSIPASVSDDRIVLSVDGSTLPGTNGGGGGSPSSKPNVTRRGSSGATNSGD